MTNDLRPYPDYKQSGLPCLESIPAHWDVRRNGRLFAQRNETGYGGLPILEVSLKTGVRIRDMDDLKRKQVMSDREKYKRAAKGDIAYNMMRMWQGAVGVAPVDGLVSPAYVVAKPYPAADPQYFSYLFRTDAYKNEVDAFSRGIVKDRNRLYWEDFKRMPSCVPPLGEQKAIADYLDANAVKVRRFIRNRRRLIEVLNEQKQAIINRAVTRGLDPNVPLKPSGIDWLGDIPAHWEILKLKRLGRIRYGLGQPPKELPSGLPLIRATNVKSGRIIKKNLVYVDPADVPPGKDAILRRDEIVVVRSGALTADSAIIPEEYEGAVAGYDMVVTVLKALPSFVAAALLSRYMLADQLFLLKSRAAQPHINAEELGSALIVLPPKEEQKAIVRYVNEQTASLGVLIDRTEREIDLIREYRTRLIADVVTGKVDVRGLAPAEPIPADEQIAEGTDDEEMPGDDEPELVEEAGA